MTCHLPAGEPEHALEKPGPFMAGRKTMTSVFGVLPMEVAA
jgi:hypothetical protein